MDYVHSRFAFRKWQGRSGRYGGSCGAQKRPRAADEVWPAEKNRGVDPWQLRELPSVKTAERPWDLESAFAANAVRRLRPHRSRTQLLNPQDGMQRKPRAPGRDGARVATGHGSTKGTTATGTPPTNRLKVRLTSRRPLPRHRLLQPPRHRLLQPPLHRLLQPLRRRQQLGRLRQPPAQRPGPSGKRSSHSWRLRAEQ